MIPLNYVLNQYKIIGKVNHLMYIDDIKTLAKN